MISQPHLEFLFSQPSVQDLSRQRQSRVEMSIEMDTQSPASEVKNHKSKSSKREKSSHGEKKRKREHGDDSQKKTKKHKSHTSNNEDEKLTSLKQESQINIMEDPEFPHGSAVVSKGNAVEEEGNQKPKKKKSKKHKSDREKVNDSSANGGIEVPGSLVKKSKAHKHSVREEVGDSEEERLKSKHQKRAPSIEIESENEAQAAQSKKHRDLPDRTATSSPMPIIAASSSQKLKSKKLKKSKSSKATAPTESNTSPFHTQTSSLFLPLAPVSQKHPLEGLCAEHISPLILTYYPPLSGVVLAYSNPRLSEEPFGDDGDETLLQNIDEYAVSWTWVTCEFLLFKPERGTYLEGYINLQNEGHIGVVCWNLFNASIQRKCLPSDWRWVGVTDQDAGDAEGMNETYAEDGLGYWVDGAGEKLEGTVKFRVREIETSHDKERGFLSIEGTMLSDEAENILLQEEAEQAPSRDSAGRRLGGMKSKGATSLGIPVEPDLMEVSSKPRRRKDF